VIDSTTGERPAAVSLFMTSRGIADSGVIQQPITQSYNVSDGTFEIKDLMPGTFGIIAQAADSMQLGLPRADGPPRPTASAAVTVSDGDVNNVALKSKWCWRLASATQTDSTFRRKVLPP
jgi:hypothetical protein